MLYWLFVPLRDLWSGFNIFRYITFRTAMATLSSFLIVVIVTPFLVRSMTKRSLFEQVDRSETPQLSPLQADKKKTPSMGGIVIVAAISAATLLWANLSSHIILLQLLAMACLAALGFTDDYIKIKSLNKKRGLGVFQKLGWEFLIAFGLSVIIYFDPCLAKYIEIPFLKFALVNIGVFYLIFAVLVLLVSSNAVNITDGLDGLATGSMAIVATTFVILSYVTGHMKIAHYLNIFYLQGAGELAVFCGAMAGACLGFLWFNCFPAQIFMGDTGSLALVHPGDEHHGPVLLEVQRARKAGKDGAGERVLCASALVAHNEHSNSDERIKSVADRLEKVIEDLAPFVEQHVVERSVPSLHARHFKGTRIVYHPLLEVDADHVLGIAGLPHRTPCKNLFLASREVVPGLGLEGEFLAATRAATLVQGVIKKHDPLK